MITDLMTLTGKMVSIESLPFAKGGEGSIHRIISPNFKDKYCAKIYFEKYQTNNRKKKIEFMVKNNPVEIYKSLYVICWPIEVLFENKEFRGFIMPIAFNNSILLYELCTIKIKDKLPNNWHRKYDRSLAIGIKARLMLCVNIATAINYIHAAGKFVVVDLKPQNIMITLDGKISIIDCDSMQISENNKVLYEAKVATPGYTPPEYYFTTNLNEIKYPSWDHFSIAVVFYELLLGVHPFAAAFSGKFDASTSLEDKIKNGLFVHGEKKSSIKSSPPNHDNFFLLPSTIQQLFKLAFNEGYFHAHNRPTTEEWGQQINGIINQGSLSKYINLNGVIIGFKSDRIPKFKKSPTSIKPNPNPPKKHTSTIKEKKSIMLFLTALLLQIIGYGLYHFDEKNLIKHKKIYFRSFGLAITVFCGAVSGLELFRGSLGIVTILVCLFFCYVIGGIEISLRYFLNK